MVALWRADDPVVRPTSTLLWQMARSRRAWFVSSATKARREHQACLRCWVSCDYASVASETY